MRGEYGLALAQIRIEGGDVAGNRRRAIEAIERAADRGVDLVALPELFTAGYFAFDRYGEAAESLEGETLIRISEVAADREVAVLAGTIVEDLAATAEGVPGRSSRPRRGWRTPPSSSTPAASDDSPTASTTSSATTPPRATCSSLASGSGLPRSARLRSA